MLSQSLLASVDRDALSGWGAVVHVMYVRTLRAVEGGREGAVRGTGGTVLAKRCLCDTTSPPSALTQQHPRRHHFAVAQGAAGLKTEKAPGRRGRGGAGPASCPRSPFFQYGGMGGKRERVHMVVRDGDNDKWGGWEWGPKEALIEAIHSVSLSYACGHSFFLNLCSLSIQRALLDCSTDPIRRPSEHTPVCSSVTIYSLGYNPHPPNRNTTLNQCKLAWFGLPPNPCPYPPQKAGGGCQHGSFHGRAPATSQRVRLKSAEQQRGCQAPGTHKCRNMCVSNLFWHEIMHNTQLRTIGIGWLVTAGS